MSADFIFTTVLYKVAPPGERQLIFSYYKKLIS